MLTSQPNPLQADPFPAGDPLGGPRPGRQGLMGPDGNSGLTLTEFLLVKAEEFERQRGGLVGPSLVALLRDAAAEISGLLRSR